MTQLLNINEPLTADELKQVTKFAESLISKRSPATRGMSPNGQPSRINLDALMGMCKDMGGDKSDKELIREAWDEVIDKLDR